MDSSSEILGGHGGLSSEAALKQARRRNEAAFRLAEAFQRRPLPPGRKPTIIEAHRERVPPQALWERSGQLSRGGCPVTGRSPPKPSPNNRSASGWGASTGDFWKRSGQHEPRKAPRPGAPPSGVVLQKSTAPRRSGPAKSPRSQRIRPATSTPPRRSRLPRHSPLECRACLAFPH